MNSFSSTQPSHENLREIWKMRTSPVVPWIGAGLSAEAKLPTWPILREKILQILKDEPLRKLTPSEVNFIEKEQDLWIAFQVLIEKIGRPYFQSLINKIFEGATSCKIPEVYKKLWKLDPRGIVSLNIDPIAQRAASQILGDQYVATVNNRNLSSFGKLFQGKSKFLANLHGVLDQGESWVFTQKDFGDLQSSPAYKQFLSGLFSSNIVVFLGISADDRGAIGHLKYLIDMGIDMGTHFWVTDRQDGEALELCRKLGLQIISYGKGAHSESLSAFLADLENYTPKEHIAEPIIPNTGKKRNLDLPSADQLLARPCNDVRKLLNQKAVNILTSGSPDRDKEYRDFVDDYEEAIHRAWLISRKLPNEFFDYNLSRRISADGAFGQVFQAKSKTEGDASEYAIKLVHDRIRDEDEMLTAFRRGVESMRILTSRNIEGIVKIVDAWELPPSLVMEFVPGLNLQEAIENRQISSIGQVLEIGRQLTSIVFSAHRLPERVLHRDIRPANVILNNFYHVDDVLEVKVLDFDLSWHKDAIGKSLEIRSAPNGYVAPEQVDPLRKKLTRNALVDSFGIGMTLYFMCSGRHPVPGVHLGAEWEKSVHDGVSKLRISFWRSTPKRLARLILRATDDGQHMRPLIDQLLKELEILCRFEDGKIDLTLTNYIAEEISARIGSLSGRWHWDDATQSIEVQSPSGLRIQLRGGDYGKVLISINWEHSGELGYSDVRKYMGPKTDKSLALLKGAGAAILSKDVRFDRCRIEAEVEIARNNEEERINKLSKMLEEIFSVLQFS